MAALAPIFTRSPITAVGWMPTGGGTALGPKVATTRANAKSGFDTTIWIRLGAVCGAATSTAVALVSPRYASYLGLARKLMSPGLASVRLLMPVMAWFSSPITVPPSSWATARTVTRMSGSRRSRRSLSGVTAVGVGDERLGDVQGLVEVQGALHAQLHQQFVRGTRRQLGIGRQHDQLDAVILGVGRQVAPQH